MLKQIVSQFEQMCLKLELKNDTLAVSNFHRNLQDLQVASSIHGYEYVEPHN